MPDKSRCSMPSCTDAPRARGLCNRHYLRAWTDGTLDLVAPLRLDLKDRFWDKVDKTDTCWLWTAYRDQLGYGHFNAREPLPSTLAHRIAYSWLVGPIPAGLVLDHLCREPSCVRPDHLEPVLATENTRRGLPGFYNAAKTHCKAGHPFDVENTIHYGGKRACRKCHVQWDRDHKARCNALRARLAVG